MIKELTSAQRDELIEQFVEIQVDSMDHQSLYELATEYITNSFDRLTDSEIKERIESLYDEDLYDELVDNVTNVQIELSSVYDSLLHSIKWWSEAQQFDKKEFTSDELANANTKSRIRMVTLYQIAGAKKGLVVGTGN